MGHRLSRIVTRTGDDGTTGLADGSRVAKHDKRIAALGAVDELNSQIGVLRAEPLPDDVQGVLQAVQNDLFDLGGELAMPEYLQVGDSHILCLEQSVAALNADLPALKEFILPGGTRAAALAHVCRTVCRRAERELCVLHDQMPISANLLRYLNRLSDLLFILARVLNKRAGVAEPAWRGPASA